MASELLSNALYGDLGRALKVHSQRMDVLANNLANSDTPNYKARDIDFRAALSSVQGSQNGQTRRLSTSHAGHIATPIEGDIASLRFRMPTQPSADGNTVDSSQEQARFGEASLRYEATLRFIDGRVRNLMTAITGQ